MTKETDHDTIIQLVSTLNDFKVNVNDKFADLKADIKDLRDGISARVVNLEKTKADRVEIDAVQKRLDDDIEIRMRKQEAFQNNLTGRLLVISFIMSGVVSLVVLWVANMLKIKN